MKLTPGQRRVNDGAFSAARVSRMEREESVQRVDEMRERVRKMIEEKRGE